MKLLRMALLLVCTLGWSSLAAASGLTTRAASGDTLELRAPSAVELHFALDDSEAVVTESRRYVLTTNTFEVEPLEFRYHRSLDDAAELLAAEVDWGSGWSELKGEIVAAPEADELRRQLVLELGEPAPLREWGRPMFVSAPLEVAASATVTIRLELRTPLAPRGTMLGVAAPIDWHPANVPSVSLDVEVQTSQSLRALYSPYHQLSVTREGDFRASAQHSGRDVCSRFDAGVLISSGDEAVRLDLLPFAAARGDDEGGYVLGLLTPPKEGATDASPGRDIVVALDVSGSMAGDKIAQAKQALSDVVSGLRADDTLAFITFASEAQADADAARSASDETKNAVLGRIAEVSAEGGTNLYDALDRAFALLPSAAGEGAARARSVVLLTDGIPTEGITDIDAIATRAAQQNEGRARVFAFGLGVDVNTLLLDRLARESGGRVLYVQEQRVEASVAAFFESIAAPVLTQPSIDWQGAGLLDPFPSQLPDVYAGQSTTFVARYADAGKRSLRLSGAGAGRVSYDYELSLPSTAPNDGSVARLWALRRVGALLDRLKVLGRDAALEAEVLSLARRFGVVTQFTYFTLDEAGNLELVFSEVPTDAVGATAVGTSSSISGYSSSETSAQTIDNTVRYFQDLNFPRRAGYHTDARLDPGGIDEWVELHFGSERYFELVANESELSMNGVLSVATDMQFEHLGRHFRVTHPARTDLDELPTETLKVPQARIPDDLDDSVDVRLLGSEVGAGSDDEPSVASTPDSGAEPTSTDAADVEAPGEESSSSSETANEGARRDQKLDADAGVGQSAQGARRADAGRTAQAGLREASLGGSGCRLAPKARPGVFAGLLLLMPLVFGRRRRHRHSART